MEKNIKSSKAFSGAAEGQPDFEKQPEVAPKEDAAAKQTSQGSKVESPISTYVYTGNFFGP